VDPRAGLDRCGKPRLHLPSRIKSLFRLSYAGTENKGLMKLVKKKTAPTNNQRIRRIKEVGAIE